LNELLFVVQPWLCWAVRGRDCVQREAFFTRSISHFETAMSLDAIVIGSGPNGLAAAITLARAGKSVQVFEAADRVGGGVRSAELTQTGFVHDICSAIHPLGVASPFFRSLPLDEFGLEWIHPPIPLAHPIDAQRVARVTRSLMETAEGFGTDAKAYVDLLKPFCDRAEQLLPELLAPLHIPQIPGLLMRFGFRGIGSASTLVERWFRDDRVRGMFAGVAAHATLPLTHRLTAAVGLMFCILAHTSGWPFPRGGSEQLAIAMRRYFESIGGTITVNTTVRSIAELPAAKAILLDVSPRQLVQIAGSVLPSSYCAKLLRFQHGPASFKIDLALSGPIPWQAEACRQAGTVHVGGTFEEIAQAEKSVWNGTHAERPFVLVAQQSLFDGTRAPAGKHTAWAYCHVPKGCELDMTDAIESQIERFAPGFRDLVIARHRMFPRDLEHYNANYIGGDISGGVMNLWQTFARPVSMLRPYATPSKKIFLCSASTPPGPGVHGMCGWHAAQAVLRTTLR
jgi:phytoene dehydrogenase-like protein